MYMYVLLGNLLIANSIAIAAHAVSSTAGYPENMSNAAKTIMQCSRKMLNDCNQAPDLIHKIIILNNLTKFCKFYQNNISKRNDSWHVATYYHTRAHLYLYALQEDYKGIFHITETITPQDAIVHVQQYRQYCAQKGWTTLATHAVNHETELRNKQKEANEQTAKKRKIDRERHASHERWVDGVWQEE